MSPRACAERTGQTAPVISARHPEPAAHQQVVPTRVTTRLLSACLACAAVFAVLTAGVAVSASWLTGLDRTISQQCFTFTVSHNGFGQLTHLATALGDGRTIAVLTTAAVIWCLVRRRWMLAGWLAVVVAGSALLSTLVKNAVERTRPPTLGVLASAHGFSFPSGHTQAATVTYAAIVLVVGWILIRPGPAVRRVSAVLVVLVVGAVGLSRVFLGVHWPTDVLGGWLIGSAWVTGAAYVLVRYLPPGRARSDPPHLPGDPAARRAE